MLAEAGLSFSTDVIVEEALKRSLPRLDLRDERSAFRRRDFSNSIEPLELGANLMADSCSERVRITRTRSEEAHQPANELGIAVQSQEFIISSYFHR